MSDDSAPNRGRVQAQGGGTEESESWPPPTSPPTKSQMLVMLERLRAKLTRRERDDRESCFQKARKCIVEAPSTGYDSHCIKTFPNRKMKGGIRVDIEIQFGKACVDDP